MALTPETVLQSRYRIIRQLGQGGMGAVYEAVDERFNSTVALKETFFQEESLRKAFEREANLLHRLRHPAVPRVTDHFTEDGGQFLVMEFISGEDLWQMAQGRRGPFPPDKVLDWADQVLDALDYLHSQQPPVVHRDIKPQNLKLTEEGRIILLDFGLAKGTFGLNTSLITSRSVMGFTPSFAPLEQMQGAGTGPKSDLYSLAATLYYLLTWEVPPDALSRASAIMSEQPDPLRPSNEVNGGVSAPVAEVIQQAMATNPAKRPRTAAEMREALRKVTESYPPADNRTAAEDLPPTVIQPAPTIPAQEQSAERGLTEIQKLQLEYWTAFREFLLRNSGVLKPQKPQAQPWFNLPLGRSYFRLEAFTQRKGRKICVYLVLAGPDAKPHFHLLKREEEAIEQEIGESLEWSERQTKEQSYIFLCKYKTDPEYRQDWAGQHEWLKEKLELFHRVFAPRVKTLNAGDYVPGEESEVKPARADSAVAATTIASPVASPPAPSPEPEIDDSPKAHRLYAPSARKSKRLPLIIGGIAAALVIALAIYLISSSKEGSTSNSAATLNDVRAELVFSRLDFKAFNQGGFLEEPTTTTANLSIKYVEQLKSVEGVESVTPIIRYFNSNRDNVEIVDGVDWPSYSAMNGTKILSGRTFLAQDQHPVLISQEKADKERLKVDDTLKIFGDETFYVVGIFEADGFSDVKIPLARMQDSLEAPEKCSFILVKCKSADEQKEVAERINATLPGNKVSFTNEVFRATPAPQVSSSPPSTSAGLNVQITARGESLWVSVWVDDSKKARGILLEPDRTETFAPAERLRIQYARVKARALEVVVNGRKAQVPADASELVITNESIKAARNF